MLAPRWKKVVRDLAHDRTRTALVVLSIAIGVLVFGTILAGATVLSRELSVSFLATNPPSAILTLNGYINATTLEWLGGERGYNQLAIVVSGDRTDEAHIRDVVAPVEQLIVRGGRTVLSTEIPPPLQHPVQAFLPTS